jgi:Methyltransferase domain
MEVVSASQDKSRALVSTHSVVLARLIHERGWTRGAEIGVFEAQNLRAILMDCPQLHMIAVDHWIASNTAGPMYRDVSWRAPMDIIEERARYRLSFYGDRVRIIKGDSVEAAKQVDDASLDFVFVDGDHSEGGVIADVIAWLPKLRPGGTMLGHDVSLASVQRGLRFAIGTWQVLPGDVWISG